MAKFTLKNGFAPVIGKGLTEWDYIHVHDVSDLILKLVESAQDSKITQNPEFFGAHGYYFCEAGPFKWGDVAKCEFITMLSRKLHYPGFSNLRDMRALRIRQKLTRSFN